MGAHCLLVLYCPHVLGLEKGWLMFWGKPRLSAHEHHCLPVQAEGVNGVECSCRPRKTGVERQTRDPQLAGMGATMNV